MLHIDIGRDKTTRLRKSSRGGTLLPLPKALVAQCDVETILGELVAVRISEGESLGWDSPVFAFNRVLARGVIKTTLLLPKHVSDLDNHLCPLLGWTKIKGQDKRLGMAQGACQAAVSSKAVSAQGKVLRHKGYDNTHSRTIQGHYQGDFQQDAWLRLLQVQSAALVNLRGLAKLKSDGPEGAALREMVSRLKLMDFRFEALPWLQLNHQKLFRHLWELFAEILCTE